ncbi:MAG: Zn-ribbon domain-containing OB-fold protein [Alphaproteobacteria bacterium]|nr:Zn-ribbon domain-containing OB-fold protein [Alphaproteobacteria bacterium]
MEIERLYPLPNPDSQPYWDGLKDRRLMLQQCGDCGTIRHYPRPVCDQCYSMEVEWAEASRRGTVHSWSVSHHAFHPSFKEDLPTTFVTVDLEENVRLVGILRDADAILSIGLPVEIRFEDAANGAFTIPVLVAA